MAKRGKRLWIKQALGTKRRYKGLGPHHKKAYRVEPLHKGALHRALGVPEHQTIPLELVRKAAKAPGKLGQQARLALTLRKMPHPTRHRY